MAHLANRMLRRFSLSTPLCTALSHPRFTFVTLFTRGAVTEAASVASEGTPSSTSIQLDSLPSDTPQLPSRFDNSLSEKPWRFHLDSHASAKELVRSLHHEQKRLLLSALHECASLAVEDASDVAQAEQIFKRADRRYPRGLLDREEFIRALRAHKIREEQERLYQERLPVPLHRLVTLGVATGLPFVAFGFLDNFIMIMAGESIERTFGVTMGLSIMAAAAWGNLISDVAGVCFAENIESAARKVLGLHAPKLSRIQQNMMPVRVAKTLGAVLGISLGCILGMLPLFWF